MLLNNQSFLKFPTSTPSSDPYWNNVVLFLKGDGTNGSTNIIDSSPTPKTITVNGNTQISTAQSKYGQSILFDGNGDYLSTANSSDFSINNSSFTIEFWIYALSLPSGGNWDEADTIICTQDRTNGSTGWTLSISSNSTIQWINNGGSVGSGASISLNTWTHIAMSNTGTSGSIYKNGVLVETVSTSHTNSSDTLRIGALLYSFYNYYFNGYIDSLRVTKGVARYTSNFNPETDTYLS